MTNTLDLDRNQQKSSFLFEADELDKFGLRMRPAEFSRLIGCSKQAVSLWVRDGKITLGADGRVDPNVAVRQLMKNTDPARLRARVLQPLLKDVRLHLKKIEAIESALASEKEEREFAEFAAKQTLEFVDIIRDQLLAEWDSLRVLPADLAMVAFCAWLEHASENMNDDGALIEDFLAGVEDSGAPESEEGGEGIGH